MGGTEEGRCSWCFRWLLREGDTPIDIRIKKSLAPLAYFFIPAGFYWLYGFYTAGDRNIYASSITHLSYILPMIVFLVKARLGHSMSEMVDLLVLGSFIGTLCVDWFAAAELRARYWNLVVMLLDMTLVFERDRMIPIVIVGTMAYLTFEGLESAARFGAYEVVTSVPIVACDCADPPCALPFENVTSNVALAAVVLLTDFYLTRGFAGNLRLQLRRVNTSVEVAAKIVAALAKYDVEGAEEVIKGGRDLPEELAQSFMQLLINLRSYKAYLPHSCLVRTEAIDDKDTPSVEDAQIPDARQEPSDDGSHGSGSTRGSFTSRQSLTSESARATGALKAVPHRVRVSLAAGNMIGYLTSQGDLTGDTNAEWISGDVEQWCAGVAATKGVVDLIGGDRRYASFNARAKCGDHAGAAVEALSVRGGDGERSGCVVTGQAVCGDFGSASVLRFMVLGR
eukprot:Hpha_TRINITY_DN15256_c4_g11::TRINITY_DN15256_c4_g11_i2::g.65081::m.65081